MKKAFAVCILSIAIATTSFSQIGIGTPAPNASAMLDIVSPAKGLLLPRVALTGTTDVATIASPATSLLVYNTASAGSGSTAVAPGFYYWNGLAWTLLNTGTSWQLNGNANAAATDFIGTTNNIGFTVKTNNLPRLIVENSGNTLIGRNLTALTAVAQLHLLNDNNINSFYVTNTSTNTTQFGVRSLCKWCSRREHKNGRRIPGNRFG